MRRGGGWEGGEAVGSRWEKAPVNRTLTAWMVSSDCNKMALKIAPPISFNTQKMRCPQVAPDIKMSPNVRRRVLSYQQMLPGAPAMCPQIGARNAIVFCQAQGGEQRRKSPCRRSLALCSVQW